MSVHIIIFFKVQGKYHKNRELIILKYNSIF